MTCPECHQRVTLSPDDYLCPACGKKIRETPEELARNIAAQQAAHSIRRARLYLLIAAILSAASVLFTYLTVANRWAWVPDDAKTALYASGAAVLVLFVLWALARPWPLPSTILALALWGGGTALAIAMSPAAALASPFVTTFRLFVTAALVSGVLAAFKHRRLATT